MLEAAGEATLTLPALTDHFSLGYLELRWQSTVGLVPVLH